MIFITGASGFIGQELLLQLHNMNLQYIATARSKADGKLQHDLSSETDWSGSFRGVSSVIHLGGLAHNSSVSIEDYKEVNTEGTLNLAKQAADAGVSRFVFVSSIGVLGNATFAEPFDYTDPPSCYNYYALSKLNAEIGLKKIADETDLEVVIVRPTLVYGPDAPGNFGALTRLVSLLPALPFGLANNKRDFIAVQNLADFLITCANHPKAAGHTFLASDSETVSIKEFTNSIADGLDKRLIQLPIPISLMKLTGKLLGKSAMVEQLVGNLEVDSSKAQEVLGWVPRYTMKQAMASLSEKKNDTNY